jgi:hypothetical protein
MVIQPVMSPKAITDVWTITNDVFMKYNVPISDKALETIVETDVLKSILNELNSIVGSSPVTCIEGG